YRDGGKADTSWDIDGLEAAVFLQGTLNDPSDRDDGWTVELAIPWRALAEHAPEGRAPRAGEEWRMNFSRVQWQLEVAGGRYQKVTDPGTGKPLPEDNWVWSPQGAVNMHMPEMWGVVRFGDVAVDQRQPGAGSQHD
ncbi:MAG: carbohydrate-binding family 9-like protein, partial [Planctomycetota bacterium]